MKSWTVAWGGKWPISTHPITCKSNYKHLQQFCANLKPIEPFDPDEVCSLCLSTLWLLLSKMSLDDGEETLTPPQGGITVKRLSLPGDPSLTWESSHCWWRCDHSWAVLSSRWPGAPCWAPENHTVSTLACQKQQIRQLGGCGGVVEGETPCTPTCKSYYPLNRFCITAVGIHICFTSRHQFRFIYTFMYCYRIFLRPVGFSLLVVTYMFCHLSEVVSFKWIFSDPYLQKPCIIHAVWLISPGNSI